METIKLYEQNAYKMDFEGIVVNCKAVELSTDDEFYQIELTQTCFFPEGGGQKGDTGLLNEDIVFDTQIKDGVITHYTKNPLEIGLTVYGQVNWKQRHSYMQHHTGEHILSGLIYRCYGYQNVGFHLSDNKVTVDVEHELNQLQIEELELAANRIIWENLSIEVAFPSEMELDELHYRSKKEIDGQIRIVSIPNVDTCACCAPHLKRTGEVGAICISRWEKYKGGVRLELKCGAKALADYRKLLNMSLNLSGLLSAKIENIEEAVEKIILEKDNDKEKLFQLQKMQIEERVKEVCAQEGKIVSFDQEMDTALQKVYLNLLMKKEAKIYCVFIGNDERGYRYQIASNSIDLKLVQNELKQQVQAKGGGNKNLIQGSLMASEVELRKLIKKI